MRVRLPARIVQWFVSEIRRDFVEISRSAIEIECAIECVDVKFNHVIDLVQLIAVTCSSVARLE